MTTKSATRKASLLGLIFSVLVTLAATAAPAHAVDCTIPGGTPIANWDVVPPSCFEGGDGNLTVQNALGPNRTDWATIAENTATDASGTEDLAFASGNAGKEFDPKKWVLIKGEVTPDKIDLASSATKIDPVTGNLFLYAAFRRIGSTGDANVSFELNQDATLWDNDGNPATPAVPTRTAGDLLITFDGNQNPDVGICQWKGPKEGTSVDANAGWYTADDVRIGGNTDCTEVANVASAADVLAIGGMNTATSLPNPGYLANFPDPIPANTFGEISINLTKALSLLTSNPSPCFDYGSIWLHSRNSTSSSADMGDYFAPSALIGAAACKIDVAKEVRNETYPNAGGVAEQAPGQFYDGSSTEPVYASTGDTLRYRFTVTNSGQATLTTGPNVTDPKCAAAPTRTSINGDASGLTFDPGDVWTYECTYEVVAGDPGTIPNTVTVSGSIGAKQVGDSDSAEVYRFGSLVLDKVAVGGDSTFTFGRSADLGGGTVDVAGATATNLLGQTLYTRLVPTTDDAAKDYVLTEQAEDGWKLTAVSCSNQGSTTNLATGVADAAIARGEQVTCTFTNTKDTKLVVIKDVVNDDGGTATAGDFGINVAAQGIADADKEFAGVASPGRTIVVQPGQYAVTEDDPTALGYDDSYSADCSGTIAVGQTKTCTVTNDDVAPKLNVVKVVQNDAGGTALPSAFTMTVTGTDVSDTEFPGASAPGTQVTLRAGSYSVDEKDLPSGYEKLSESADCEGTIAVGQEKTCTITNGDVAPKLNVIKVVTNDDGGTAVPGDFTMTVNGTDVSDAEFPGASAPGTQVTLDAGQYAVDEKDLPSGYEKVGASADCSGSIAVGQTKTCTITNSDIAPELTVVKNVVNDDGGTKGPGDFELSVAGASASPGTFAGSAQGVKVTVKANEAYEVTEKDVDGYAEIKPRGEQPAGACTGPLQPGQKATCTLTNSDVAAKLVVIKQVVNKDGSSAVPGDFTLGVTGVNVEGTTPFQGEAAPGTEFGLDAGAYEVTEQTDPNYAVSYSADCAGTIANGQTKTCTVTNTRKTGSLTVIKSLSPAADPGRFDLLVNGTVKAAAVGDGGTTGKLEVKTGTYSVSEAAVAPASIDQYQRSIACVAGGQQIASSPSGGAVQVPVADGADVVCTVTNRRLAVGIGLTKVGPATAQAGDTITFALEASNTGETSFDAGNVVLTDALCVPGPVLVSKNGDGSPDTFDPSDRWTYSCAVPTVVGQTRVDNVGTVNGTDKLGQPASATANASTLLSQPVTPQAPPPEPVRGRAAIAGPQGCVKAASASVWVTGQQVLRVKFTLNGKTIKTVTKADSKGRFLVKLTGKQMRKGIKRVKATVTYRAASQTGAQVKSLSFSRCAPKRTAATVG